MFNKFFVAACLAAALATTVVAEDKKPVEGGYAGPVAPEQIPGYLQDISVTIHAGGAQGSGVIKTRDGVNYVLTAGHVVSHLKKTRSFIDPATGSLKTRLEFEDAKIVKEVYQDGRSVGRLEMDAEILRYSDADNGDDLALLRVRKRDFIKCSVKFDAGDEPVPVGTDLLHVGSLLGQMGSNSLTSGIVSQHGRVINNVVYDQSTCAAFPGSSGGGLYRKSDGQYVGMIVRGAGETFNMYVPMRRIHAWAKRTGVNFVVDDAVAVPDDATLRKIPVIEEAGSNPSACDKCPDGKTSDELKALPFLIKLTGGDKDIVRGSAK